MLNFRDQGDDLSCRAQIGISQVAELAARGYRSIICNRPDSEEGAVPSADIATAAQANGMAFLYLPVEFSALTSADGERFGEALDSMPRPIVAYCRTGRRCAALWALARAPKLGADAVLSASRTGGCDIDELRPKLADGPNRS
jgi:sulfide:quinone oxidoreductase